MDDSSHNPNHKREERRDSERREYKRFSKHFILTYYDREHPKEKHSASQLRNISLGGMCLITSKYFAPSSVLEIELKTPFYAELTYLVGQVVKSNEKIEDVIYETHLQFVDVNHQTEYVLSKLIEHLDTEDDFTHE